MSGSQIKAALLVCCAVLGIHRRVLWTCALRCLVFQPSVLWAFAMQCAVPTWRILLFAVRCPVLSVMSYGLSLCAVVLGIRYKVCSTEPGNVGTRLAASRREAEAKFQPKVAPYAPDTTCPVLTSRMVLLPMCARHTVCGTERAHVRARYTVCSTEIAYGGRAPRRRS
eukprot:1710469-Rhodomonas_salina.1